MDTPLTSQQKAALVVLRQAGGRLPVVVLNKVLFYLDLHAYLELGHTVTGAAYVALHQGPVVAKYDQRLIPPLVKAGLVAWEQKGSSKPVVLTGEVPAELDPAVMPLLKQVLDHVGQLKSSAASDYSHQNPGWRVAYEEGLRAGKPPRPINLDLALQQLAEDDPWLTEPLSPAEQRAFDEDIAGPDHPWE